MKAGRAGLRSRADSYKARSNVNLETNYGYRVKGVKFTVLTSNWMSIGVDAKVKSLLGAATNFKCWPNLIGRSSITTNTTCFGQPLSCAGWHSVHSL